MSFLSTDTIGAFQELIDGAITPIFAIDQKIFLFASIHAFGIQYGVTLTLGSDPVSMISWAATVKSGVMLKAVSHYLAAELSLVFTMLITHHWVMAFHFFQFPRSALPLFSHPLQGWLLFLLLVPVLSMPVSIWCGAGGVSSSSLSCRQCTRLVKPCFLLCMNLAIELFLASPFQQAVASVPCHFPGTLWQLGHTRFWSFLLWTSPSDKPFHP